MLLWSLPVRIQEEDSQINGGCENDGVPPNFRGENDDQQMGGTTGWMLCCLSWKEIVPDSWLSAG